MSSRLLKSRSRCTGGNYQRGLITGPERYNQVLDTWTHARDEITKAMMVELENDERGGRQYLNPIFLMATRVLEAVCRSDSSARRLCVV